MPALASTAARCTVDVHLGTAGSGNRPSSDPRYACGYPRPLSLHRLCAGLPPASNGVFAVATRWISLSAHDHARPSRIPSVHAVRMACVSAAGNRRKLRMAVGRPPAPSLSTSTTTSTKYHQIQPRERVETYLSHTQDSAQRVWACHVPCVKIASRRLFHSKPR